VAGGQSDAAEITREAASRFVRSHLAPCAEPLASLLAGTGAELWTCAARALLARAGPRPADTEGDWVPEELGVEDCSLSCALGGGAGGSEASAAGDEVPPEFFAGLPRDPRRGAERRRAGGVARGVPDAPAIG
jgi:hypothetical protein